MAQDSNSYVTGKTEGAAIKLGDYTPDLTKLREAELIAINNKSQELIDLKKEIEDITSLSVNAWKFDQAEIDADLDALKENSIKRRRETFEKTGSPLLTYEQQREEAFEKDKIMKKAKASLEEQKPYEVALTAVLNDKDNKIEQQNLVEYTNMNVGERDPSILLKYRKQLEELMPDPVDEVIDIYKESIENPDGTYTEGNTINTLNKNATWNNVLGQLPKSYKMGDDRLITLNNRAILDKYAIQAGYKDANEWYSKKPDEAYGTAKSLNMIKIKSAQTQHSISVNDKKNEGLKFIFNNGRGGNSNYNITSAYGKKNVITSPNKQSDIDMLAINFTNKKGAPIDDVTLNYTGAYAENGEWSINDNADKVIVNSPTVEYRKIRNIDGKYVTGFYISGNRVSSGHVIGNITIPTTKLAASSFYSSLGMTEEEFKTLLFDAYLNNYPNASKNAKVVIKDGIYTIVESSTGNTTGGRNIFAENKNKNN